MEQSVISVVDEIKKNLSQKSSSQKDEVVVMQAMLNDSTYKVGVYSKQGKTGEYCPYEDSRKMVGNIISETTGLGNKEATGLAEQFEFTKSESGTMVNISKEFINTYLHTGRKLPLGAREKSDVSLMIKEVKETEKKFPNSIGNSEDKTYKTATIPAHESVRVIAPCPSYLK